MPGKQARVLWPVCAEPMPPDETECANCGAFVIDEAVVRLSRAFGLDREKALKLFEAGFRHTKQLRDRNPNGILEKGEVGLLFICTNCGGFVAAGDTKCLGARRSSRRSRSHWAWKRTSWIWSCAPPAARTTTPSSRNVRSAAPPFGGRRNRARWRPRRAFRSLRPPDHARSVACSTRSMSFSET